MKNIFLLFALSLAFTVGIAQTNVYHPFPESDAAWNFNFTEACIMGDVNEDYSIVMSGDTSINSLIYHKLSTPFVWFQSTGVCSQTHMAGYRGAVRQDIANRKVFYVPPASATEVLLYDFTMQVGDTVKGFLQSYSGSGDTVVSIDSVMVGDNYRKRWLINPCYEIYFIEGIGATYGLLEISPGCSTDGPVYSIYCFSLSGQSVYPDTTADCPLITAVNPVAAITDEVNVFPNPFADNLYIRITKPTANYAVFTLRDVMGKTVSVKTATALSGNGLTTLNAGNLAAGVYFLEIKINGNNINREVIKN